MKVNRALIALLAVSMCVVSTGCKQKPNYEAMYNDMLTAYNDSVANVETLNLALASYDEKYKESVDLSRYTVLDTGERVYQKFNDKVYMDGKVDFNAVDSISNSSKLYLTDDICLSPSDAWTVNLSTSQTNLYNNSNKISGNIEVYKVYNGVSQEFVYNTYIDPFVVANNLNVIEMLTTFTGEYKSGNDIKCKIKVKSIDDNSSTRYLKANEILTADELAESQAEADRLVQESEAARIQEFMETIEDVEPETIEVTNESGETVTETVEITLPETINSAPDVGNNDVEVKLPAVKVSEQDCILRVGVINCGDKAILYKFVYADDNTAGSSEQILNNLITSFKLSGYNVTLGQ